MIGLCCLTISPIPSRPAVSASSPTGRVCEERDRRDHTLLLPPRSTGAASQRCVARGRDRCRMCGLQLGRTDDLAALHVGMRPDLSDPDTAGGRVVAAGIRSRHRPRGAGVGDHALRPRGVCPPASGGALSGGVARGRPTAHSADQGAPGAFSRISGHPSGRRIPICEG